jgi:hypothetical protein
MPNRFLWKLLCLVLLAGSALIGEAQTASFPPPETKIGDLEIVVVKADMPSMDIRALVEMLKAERAKGPDELNVLVGGLTLNIGPEPRVPDERPVYPNPLLLVVKVDAKGNIELNNEKQGSLSNVSTITNRLRQLFQERERSGTFRENSNEVEKTVSVRLDPGLKVSDLDKITTALDAAYADPMILLIDEEPKVEQLPLVLPLIKKRKS